MYFLSLSSSPTGQNLLFYHHYHYVCLPGLTLYFAVYRNVPTSFQSPNGHVLHRLQAKLKRSKKLTIRAATVLNFVAKTDVNIPGLMVWNRWVELPVNNRGRMSDNCVMRVCSFRTLNMTAKERLSDLALGMFWCMFTLLIGDTSKVRRCLNESCFFFFF